MSERIGIVGGTFDPPHIAHLMLAEEALHSLNLDEVWFIPVYTPPHKNMKSDSTPEQRLELIKAAVNDHPDFHVSTIEYERRGPSYSIDTIRALKEEYTNASFYFIIGGDMKAQLHTWKDIELLKKLVTFAVADRPGYFAEKMDEDGIQYIEAPLLDISSTDIRERMRLGKSIRYYVTEEVRDFIEKQGLYE
ncbi:nicotinate-nucleotide adenylyltransferase [Sinobaca sp. H24]|uniref:nicotinate-nucleotide adenylyltransferase n=1 Tax=Sinobaca sp. H24 TaxID=2923376 RepID=UPI002079CF13|nr:nicotinate-nucleotide adenylyltransferase [Sinobaca sp. H24]